ncbi:MAG: SH3 domain-containing protein, partial [Planctomycetota bacterium]
VGAARAEPDVPAAPDSPVTGVVNATRLNVRLRPDLASPVLGQVKRDARLVVRKLAAGWCEIDYPATLNVWTSAKLLRADSEKLQRASPAEPVAGVARRSGTRLRATPSVVGAIVGELSRGQDVAVVARFGEWLRIVPPPDLRGYVSADYVELVKDPPPASAESPGGASGAPKVGPRPGATAATTAAAVPKAAAARIELAGGLLGDADSSLDETRRALALLEEALTLEDLDEAAREAVRLRVRQLLGGLPPSRWLGLFEEAEERHRRELEAIRRRYGERLGEARRSLEEAPALEFTARGVLRSPAAGSERYRLTYKDTPLYELDPRGADLAPFVDRRVGVIGERRDADRPGGVPVIEIRHVEAIGSPARPGRPQPDLSAADPTGAGE